MSGINVDALNQPPDPAQVHALGATWVRVTCRSASEVASYVHACHDAGLKVLGALDKDADGNVMGGICDVYQIGNEPDLSSPSSWTRTPDEYVEDCRLYTQTYPQLTFIGAGLASGDVSYWRNVGPRVRQYGIRAVAVHPYAKTASQAQTLLNQYKAVRPDLGVWITEWFRDPDQVVPFSRMLRQYDNDFWFCAGDWMVDGMGLWHVPGELKAHGHMWRTVHA